MAAHYGLPGETVSRFHLDTELLLRQFVLQRDGAINIELYRLLRPWGCWCLHITKYRLSCVLLAMNMACVSGCCEICKLISHIFRIHGSFKAVANCLKFLKKLPLVGTGEKNNTNL
jgi:hypothetical protein